MMLENMMNKVAPPVNVLNTVYRLQVNIYFGVSLFAPFDMRCGAGKQIKYVSKYFIESIHSFIHSRIADTTPKKKSIKIRQIINRQRIIIIMGC